MTEYDTYEYVREHAHIGMPMTTSNDGKSLVIPVGNVISQFSFGSKLVGKIVMAELSWQDERPFYGVKKGSV